MSDHQRPEERVTNRTLIIAIAEALGLDSHRLRSLRIPRFAASNRDSVATVDVSLLVTSDEVTKLAEVFETFELVASDPKDDAR